MTDAVVDLEPEEILVGEDEGALKPSHRWRTLLFLLAFSPVIALGFAIAANAVDIPVWDDWERGEMWQRYHEGTLDFDYLYSPHIEHRSLFPRLISLACGFAFDGDLRAEIWAIYLVMVGTTLLCFRLLSHTLEHSPALWPAAFLINLILCCPVQYPDFLWAAMFAFMVPFWCLAAILVAGISTRLPIWAKFLVFVVACEIGTHSFSEGLVLWPVAVCLPLFSPVGFGSMRGRTIFAGAMLVIGVLTLIPYFTWHFETTSTPSHTYSTATGETSSNFSKLKEVFKKPKAPREYFFKALGNPAVRLFDENPARSARDVGRVLFAAFLAALGFLFWKRTDRETWIRLLPWVAAAFFAVTTAALLAIGRSSSPHRATMPRYIPMTVFLLVALVAIAAYVIVWWSRRAKDEQNSARRAAGGWGAGAVCAVLLMNEWGYGLVKMRAWRDARFEARAALVYIKLFEPKRIGRIDNTYEFVRTQAARMSDYGLLHPRIVDEWGFGPFERDADPIDRGVVSISYDETSRTIALHGFAETLDGRVADGILVAHRPDPDGEPEVLGFVEMHSALVPMNPFVDGHFGDAPDLSDPEHYAAFDGQMAFDEGIEVAPGTIECWALDARKMRAHRIP